MWDRGGEALCQTGANGPSRRRLGVFPNVTSFATPTDRTFVSRNSFKSLPTLRSFPVLGNCPQMPSCSWRMKQKDTSSCFSHWPGSATRPASHQPATSPRASWVYTDDFWLLITILVKVIMPCLANPHKVADLNMVLHQTWYNSGDHRRSRSLIRMPAVQMYESSSI